jgi:hypothetical protein
MPSGTFRPSAGAVFGRYALAAAVAGILAAGPLYSNALSLPLEGFNDGIRATEVLNVARYNVRSAQRHHYSTSAHSPMLARRQLGNAFKGSRAATNASTGERASRRSRCNGRRCAAPNPPSPPGTPIPYPNSGATSR